MTTFDTARPAPFLSTVLYRIVTAGTALRDWSDARRTVKALSSLTARELDDIGLTRSDIERIAYRR